MLLHILFQNPSPLSICQLSRQNPPNQSIDRSESAPKSHSQFWVFLPHQNPSFSVCGLIGLVQVRPPFAEEPREEERPAGNFASFLGFLFFQSRLSETMAAKIKGIYKGFKFISHLFEVKEREMEIGHPTDIKHLAHIGVEGPDGAAPSWMNEFKTGPDFTLSSVGSMGGSCRDPNWTSQDLGQPVGRQQRSDIFNSFPPANHPGVPNKQKHKKGKSSSSSRKSNSSPKSNSSSRSGRSRKSNLGKEMNNADI